MGAPANVNRVVWAAMRALNMRRITSRRYFGDCFATYKHLAAKKEKGITRLFGRGYIYSEKIYFFMNLI